MAFCTQGPTQWLLEDHQMLQVLGEGSGFQPAFRLWVPGRHVKVFVLVLHLIFRHQHSQDLEGGLEQRRKGLSSFTGWE